MKASIRHAEQRNRSWRPNCYTSVLPPIRAKYIASLGGQRNVECDDQSVAWYVFTSRTPIAHSDMLAGCQRDVLTFSLHAADAAGPAVQRFSELAIIGSAGLLLRTDRLLLPVFLHV